MDPEPTDPRAVLAQMGFAPGRILIPTQTAGGIALPGQQAGGVQLNMAEGWFRLHPSGMWVEFAQIEGEELKAPVVIPERRIFEIQRIPEAGS